jgi:hypothetical protein
MIRANPTSTGNDIRIFVKIILYVLILVKVNTDNTRSVNKKILLNKSSKKLTTYS